MDFVTLDIDVSVMMDLDMTRIRQAVCQIVGINVKMVFANNLEFVTVLRDLN